MKHIDQEDNFQDGELELFADQRDTIIDEDKVCSEGHVRYSRIANGGDA